MKDELYYNYKKLCSRDLYGLMRECTRGCVYMYVYVSIFKILKCYNKNKRTLNCNGIQQCWHENYMKTSAIERKCNKTLLKRREQHKYTIIRNYSEM